MFRCDKVTLVLTIVVSNFGVYIVLCWQFVETQAAVSVRNYLMMSVNYASVCNILVVSICGETCLS